MQQAGYETYYTGKLYNGFQEDNYCCPSVSGWSRASILVTSITDKIYGAMITVNALLYEVTG